MADGPAIDIHTHVLILDVEALVSGHEGRHAEAARQAAWNGPESIARNRSLDESYRPKLTDPAVRLAAMDAMGVDIQVVSTSPTQYYYWAEAPLAEKVVAAANEHIAKLVTAHPDRLDGFAAVSLQHPQLAAEQLRHVVRTLGLKGVEISTRTNELELADPSLDPFWAASEDLGVVVFIHPLGCSLGERLDSYYLSNVIGNPAETTVALSHLIFGGVLDRHPGLQVCAAHGGGYLPMCSGRSDNAFNVRPESRTTAKSPSEYLRQIWFDALVYTPHPASPPRGASGTQSGLPRHGLPFRYGHRRSAGAAQDRGSFGCRLARDSRRQCSRTPQPTDMTISSSTGHGLPAGIGPLQPQERIGAHHG